MWQALQAFEFAEQLSILNLHTQRRRIMVTNYGQWLWLETALVNECRKVLEKTEPQYSGWIPKLVAKVHAVIETRIRSVVFQPKDFIPGFSCTAYHYSAPERTRIADSVDEINISTIRTFKAIVKHWLGYPAEGLSEMRFYFIAYLLRCFSPATLLLDEVWDAYQHIQHMLFGRQVRIRITPDIFSDVFARMRAHPLADPLSKETQLVNLIGGLHSEFSQLTIESVIPPPSSIPTPGRPKKQRRASREPSAPLSGTHDPSPEADIPNKASTSRPSGHTTATFIAYLRELLPLTDVDYDGLMTTLMRNVMEDPDGFLPWRLKAPCLSMVFGDGGPFSENIIDTPIGLWNALIVRGITFGCDIIQEGPQLYNSLEEWSNKVTASESKGSQYICKVNIYGNAIYNRHKGIGRSPAMAANYWNAAHASDWASMGQGEKRSFDGAVKFFRQFDLIGPLIAVLLAGDYSCAGKFDMPDAHTMGGYIKSISAGALGCMKLMGMVSGKGDKKSCQKAFVDLYEALDLALTDEEKSKMNFSPIMLEHAMCKYYKAITYKLFE